MADDPDDFPRIIASEVTEQVMQAETKRALAKSGSYTSWERVLRAYAFRSVHGTDTINRVLEERVMPFRPLPITLWRMQN